MTDTITLPRATVVQALETLKTSAVTVDSFGVQQATQDAITALRTALEQKQAEQQAEPVKPAGQLQECIYGRGQVLWFAKPADRSMLYTIPPAAQRKPLTATTIGNMMPSTIPMEHDGALMEFARAIEAAHNIKEQP